MQNERAKTVMMYFIIIRWA